MPKSRNKRKNGKTKQYKPVQQVSLVDATAEQQIQYLWGNRKPKCANCDTELRLSTSDELNKYKLNDPSYQLKFLWMPTCECIHLDQEFQVK